MSEEMTGENRRIKTDSRVTKEKICIGDVNKRKADRRQNYLHIHSPGDAFRVI